MLDVRAGATIHICHSIRHSADQKEKQVKESFVQIVIVTCRVATSGGNLLIFIYEYAHKNNPLVWE